MATSSKSRKAARFVFVDMPLGLLGITQLRIGSRVIRDLWASLRSVTCPQCKTGVLQVEKGHSLLDGPARTVRQPWNCTHCDFALLEVPDSRVVRQVVGSLRRQETIEQLGEMEYTARQKHMRAYTIRSRVFFTVGFAAFLWFLFRIATGATLANSASFASLGMAACAVALKASYRSWQIETGTLFIDGAFLHFVRRERWLR